MSAVDASGCVLVPIERLRALEALEAEMPARIEEAVKEASRKRLAELNAKRKADPVKTATDELKRYHRNKEEINARRREAYKAKKEAAKASGGTS